MSVNFEWKDDKHIMVWRFSTDWTWNEYDACFWQAKREGDAQPHPHCDLYLLPPRVQFPPKFITSSKGYLKRENLGINVYLTVMVCQDGMAFNMLSLLGRMYNWQNSITTPQYRLAVVKHETDARERIAKRLTELQWLDIEQSSLPTAIKTMLETEIKNGKIELKWDENGNILVKYPELMGEYIPIKTFNDPRIGVKA